jgi:DNA ligase D-like protein (predicted ligase)
MLPSLVESAPAGDRWLHEIKHDGYRTLLAIDRGRVTAWTRGRNDCTKRYAGIAVAASKLRCDSAIVEGEVIIQSEDGRSDFLALANAVLGDNAAGRAALLYFAFDILFLDGRDLRALPLEERRDALRGLIPRSARSPIQFSDAIAGDGAEVFAGAERLGLEGIISKRLGTRYRSGRTDRWLKTKCFTESSLILIRTERKQSGPPAALLAREEDGELVYAGKAMITLTADDRDRLRTGLERLSITRSPIPSLRKSSPTARWVKPELVVDVRHLRGSGGLRHATVWKLRD